MMSYIPAQTIKDFFNQLNNSNIEYVLIKNVANKLPNKLQSGKDIDILVNEKQIHDFQKFMKKHNYKKCTDFYRGWSFAYKLPEHQYWQYNSSDFSLYIDTCFKLSCKSLTPYVWIPLDNCINEDIWGNKVFDKNNNWWIMDEENQFVYLITRSVFDRKEFRSDYINEIEMKKEFLKHDTVKFKLSKVFFKYTDFLISQIEESNYENIIKNYLTFKSY